MIIALKILGLIDPYFFPVIHLPPLLGNEGFPGMKELLDDTLREVAKVSEAGLPGVLLENEGDPLTWRQSKGSLASFSVLTHEVRKNFPQLILGVEMLLHDPEASRHSW